MILKAQQGTSLSSGKLTLYAFDEKEHPVGCVELYNYDPINRRAAVGIVVSNEYRHKGFGSEMVQVLTEFCKANTSLHQVYADSHQCPQHPYLQQSRIPTLRHLARLGYPFR